MLATLLLIGNSKKLLFQNNIPIPKDIPMQSYIFIR